MQGELRRAHPAHTRVPDADPFALTAGGVQGRVRGRQQRAEGRAVHRGGRHARADLHLHVDPVDAERAAQLPDHRTADRAQVLVGGGGLVGQLKPTQDDGELVTAETPDQGGIRRHVTQLPRHHLE